MALGGQRRESCEKLLAAMGIDTLGRRQFSKRTGYFHVKQMRNDAGIAASGQIASQGLRQWAMGKKIHNYGRIQHNHRVSRNSHTICAALVFEESVWRAR